MSWQRYEVQAATNVQEYLGLGGSKDDLRNDVAKGYVKCDGDWKTAIAARAAHVAAQQTLSSDDDSSDSDADDSVQRVSQPGATLTFDYRDVLLIGNPDVTSQAKGGHLVSKLVLHTLNEDEDDTHLKFGMGVFAGEPSSLFAMCWGELLSEYVIRTDDDMDDGNRVRTTSALRCFEVKIDRRGAKVKCKLESKEMHMVSASNITAVATLDAPTLAAAKTALEHPKWRADMFKGIGDLGDYLQRFNNLGQLGGGARRAQVEKVNADAHHIYVKRIWPLSRDVGAARRIECVRMQSELRRLWLGFAFDEGSTAVVGDEFFQLMLASSQADFVHHLRPEYVPGLSADLPMPRMGREVRRERLQRQQTEQRTPTSPSMMSSVTAAVRGALSRSPARKKPRAAAAAPPSPTGWRLRFEEILKRVIDPSEAFVAARRTRR